MTTILYILAGIVVLVIILAMIAPKTYDVSRNIKVQQSVPVVFDYLKYLKNQDNWSPWGKRDPNMKKEFVGSDGEIGSPAIWAAI